MREKLLSTIGLCQRAGKLITGFDAVTEELKKGKTAIGGVLITEDLSDKTKKEVRFFCEKYGARLCETELGTSDIKKLLGKKTGIIAVLDEGLFTGIAGHSEKSAG